MDAVLEEQSAQAQLEKSQSGSSTKAASKAAAPRPKKAPKRIIEQDDAGLSPRRSGREPRLSEKRRASLNSSSPAARSTASRRRNAQAANVAGKRAAFEGVVLFGRRRSRVASKVEGEEENEEPAGQKTFAQVDADGDENMEVDAEAT